MQLEVLFVVGGLIVFPGEDQHTRMPEFPSARVPENGVHSKVWGCGAGTGVRWEKEILTPFFPYKSIPCRGGCPVVQLGMYVAHEPVADLVKQFQ